MQICRVIDLGHARDVSVLSTTALAEEVRGSVISAAVERERGWRRTDHLYSSPPLYVGIYRNDDGTRRQSVFFIVVEHDVDCRCSAVILYWLRDNKILMVWFFCLLDLLLLLLLLLFWWWWWWW